MAIFEVICNSKPAITAPFGQKPNNKFETFVEAQYYALLWLGEYGSFVPSEPNKKVIYTNVGDYIEISSVCPLSSVG